MSFECDSYRAFSTLYYINGKFGILYCIVLFNIWYVALNRIMLILYYINII